MPGAHSLTPPTRPGLIGRSQRGREALPVTPHAARKPSRATRPPRDRTGLTRLWHEPAASEVRRACRQAVTTPTGQVRSRPGRGGPGTLRAFPAAGRERSLKASWLHQTGRATERRVSCVGDGRNRPFFRLQVSPTTLRGFVLASSLQMYSISLHFF